MAIVTTDNQHYTDIAAAIRSKNGTETQYKPSEMAAAISAISGGGEPEPPDDGKTRLYITIPANAMPDRPPPRNQVPLYIQQSVANGVTIDWGDGTAPETLPGTWAANTTHTYEQAGDYVISLEPAEGCDLRLRHNSNKYCIMGSTNDAGKVYCNMLKKIYIGKNITSIGNYTFNFCYSLESLTIPDSVTSIGEYAFNSCYSLESLTIPDSVTSIGNNAFNSCYSLGSLTIPDSVTSIGNRVLYNCYSLESLTIPNSVTSIGEYALNYCDSISSLTISNAITSIGNNAFGYCRCVKEYHFLSSTPPTLGGTNVFDSIPSDCIIYVPKGSAEAYKTATNWTTVADKIQEEPDPIVPEILKVA